MRYTMFFLCLLGLTACAQAAPHASGVSGRVLQTPARPGPQRIDQDMSGAPAPAMAIELRSGDAVVARALSAADGAFTLHAPPGRYVLHVAVEGMYPRCEDQDVQVRKGRLVRAELRCDSGMR